MNKIIEHKYWWWKSERERENSNGDEEKKSSVQQNKWGKVSMMLSSIMLYTRRGYIVTMVKALKIK